MTRLNVFISKSGCASRRKADELIKDGRVNVNGRVVLEPFFRVNDEDVVRINNKIIGLKKPVYIVLNKPEGVTTTLKDKFAGRKVIDLLPGEFKGVFPVGRLDKNSSGLLLLTNDGDLCYRLTHPKFRIEKEYIVRLSGILKGTDIPKAKKGVLESGEHLSAKSVKVVSRTKTHTVCKVVVCEGKKRHIRRLFDALGYRVSFLQRVRIGNLRLGRLAPGDFYVTEKEKLYPLFFKKTNSNMGVNDGKDRG